MDGAATQSARGGALAAAVDFARKQPGKVLALVLSMHVVVWTLVPFLVCPNLQLDLAEDLALGKEWQLGYWKHPPLPWWLAELAYNATGQIDVVYLLGPLVTAICLYGVWLLARETVGALAGLFAVLALEGVHYYSYSSVKFAHDQMQLPFWAFTALFFFRALKRGRTLDWTLAGAMLAGAFWSKYAAVMLAATLGLFLLADPVARRAWRTPGPYLMAIAFAVVFAPNLWWLIEHDFMPLHYVDERARMAVRWYEFVAFPLQWLASQALTLLPGAALLGLVCFPSGNGKRALADEAAFDRRYVTAIAIGPFLLTMLSLTVLGRRAYAMWGYPLWSFAPLAVVMWFEPLTDPRSLRRFAGMFIAVFCAVPLIYAVAELGEPFVRDRPKATDFPGQVLAETVTREWHDRYGTPLAYVSGSEFPANNVAVFSPDRPRVVVHANPRISPWIDMNDVRRRGAVLVWEGGQPGGDLETLRAAFGDVEVQPELVLARQTWHPVRPSRLSFAFVPPHP